MVVTGADGGYWSRWWLLEQMVATGADDGYWSRWWLLEQMMATGGCNWSGNK